MSFVQLIDDEVAITYFTVQSVTDRNIDLLGHYWYQPWWWNLALVPLLRRPSLYIGITVICSCSLAVLDPRVGHTMDVLSPFIPVLCQSDWLFHGESCPRLAVVHPGRAWPSSPARGHAYLEESMSCLGYNTSHVQTVRRIPSLQL